MKLKVGDFVKTSGARDGVGLRCIAQITGDTAIVDHYGWEKVGEGYKVKRKPYSSAVMLDKIRYIYDIDADGFAISKRRYAYDSTSM